METLIVTLTISSIVTFLALIVGFVVGWVARQWNYETTPQQVFAHPEMFDEHGNLSPDEILAVRFEQHDKPEDDEEND